ncbi:hypothetical protein EDD22DRAFT_960264 [Suillus occidentalis]|nr:hypothetical protein EDD22DRAFT_960264 [Suillus occidentalis]
MPQSSAAELSTHFHDLLDELNLGVQAGRKRKIIGPLGPYLRAAQWFPLGIDPFADLEGVLYDGMEAEFSELRDEDPVQPKDDENGREMERRVQHYKNWVKLVPTFSDTISGFEKDPVAMDNFIHTLVSAASDARSDDTGSLMREGLEYMLLDPESSSFNPPLLKKHGKACRGWNHPQTARLLCPVRRLEEFDADPQAFMDGVKEGRIRITASKLPSFIYDEAIALSPNGRKGTKTPKGRIHGMTTPTPHAIAYAAVQAYFQLSSATQWCKIINEFDLVELYDRILTMFKDDGAGASWIKETIEHWKVETPGLLQQGRTQARTNEGGNSNEDSEDDMDGFFDSDEPAVPRGNGPAAHSNTPSGSTATGEGDGTEERQGPSSNGHGHPSSATGPGPGGAHNNNESSGVRSTNGHQDSGTHQNGSEQARENLDTSGNVQSTNGQLDDSGTQQNGNEGPAQHSDSQPTGKRARKAPTRSKARAPKRGHR